MSYVLHFRAKSANQPINIEKLKEYFTQLGDYDVNDYRALHSNTDTGVFFSFDFEKTKPTDPTPSLNKLPVSFNVSFGKPHIFVLEAEPELEEFIRHFDLLVSDSAIPGTDFKEYNEIDFYQAWNKGNEAFYTQMLRTDPQQKLHTLPVQLMEKCWRWNFHVNHMQSELGREIFVPRVMLIECQSGFYTAVVWTDGMPVTLPRVEKAILYRRDLVPGIHIGKHEDIALADIAEVEPLLKDYPKTTEHLEYYTIIYKEAPKEIKHFFQSRKAVRQSDVKFVSFAEIHDKETIDKVLKSL